MEDNFFELGGDSIMAIQMVARANEAGLQLSVKQLFEHQTIGRLAEVAGQGVRVMAEQGTVSGLVELTPIQRWFFEQEVGVAHHFNQAVLLEVKAGVEARVVGEALHELVKQHDALRMRYERGESGWLQVNAEVEEQEILWRVDLSGVEESQKLKRLEAEGQKAQESLDLRVGPLVRGVWFDLGVGQASRLLLVIHHLVVDGVSWRVLMEDLQQSYGGLVAGRGAGLGRKSSSYQQWAKRLVEHAQSEEVVQELEYWKKVGSERVEPLPVDEVGGENLAGYEGRVSVWLSEEETRGLVREVPEKYHTQINDALLTAVGQALSSWTGQKRVRLDLEGHGREELFRELDVNRTVGWFTTIYPVVLEVEGGQGVGRVLKSVKEQLRAVPGKGIGYGILRYLRQGRGEELKGEAAEVSFNYLGQFEQEGIKGKEPIFEISGEASGDACSAQRRRGYKLEIGG